MSHVATSKRKSYTRVLVVDEDAVQKLADAFKVFGGEVGFAIGCSDELARSDLNIRQLADYENPKRATIRCLTVGSHESYAKSAVLTVDATSSSNVRVDFRGPEVSVDTLARKVSDILAGMRPWYWWISRSYLPVVVLAPCVVLNAVATVVIYYLRIKGKVVLDTTGAVPWADAVTITFLLWGILHLLDMLKLAVFPRVSFAIGQGKKRHQTLESIRWSVVVTFLLGMIGSVIAGLLLARLQASP